MPRKRAADFDQSFLDMVEAPPSVYTAEQEAATKIDRRHKRRVKDYYPIYSDNPGGWQADLMFMPYTNSRNETRLHAILCVININSKYAFAECSLSLPTRGVGIKIMTPQHPWMRLDREVSILGVKGMKSKSQVNLILRPKS